MEAIITVGIPRSGKTTYAESLSDTHIDVNRDKIRLTLSGCRSKLDYWKQPRKKIKNTEDLVTTYYYNYIKMCAISGLNIICSDTNLNEKFREDLHYYLESVGYEITIKEFEITFEDAMKLNEKSGEDYVSREVMRIMWKRWLEYKNHKHTTFHEGLEDVYLVDIDGTVADHKGIRSPFSWDKVDKDIPKMHVINVVKNLIKCGSKVIFLSGRDSVCRDLTISWIKKHITEDVEIYMRAEGDPRNDAIVKRELYDNHIYGKYNTVGVFDDRLRVVRMWRDLGLTVFCVGDVDHDF